MIILAIENCLIKDLPTIFTTGVVSQMDNDMLERLAAESADVQVERAELEVECEALQKGLHLCKTYRTRNPTGKLIAKTFIENRALSSRFSIARSILA